MGALIDSRRVLELPINGRNVIGLATLLPGASQVSAPQMFTGDRSGPTVSMSGSRGNQNLFLFDGAHFNALFRNTGFNYPPPDALQEVKVLTNSFSAEYGRNASAVFSPISGADGGAAFLPQAADVGSGCGGSAGAGNAERRGGVVWRACATEG